MKIIQQTNMTDIQSMGYTIVAESGHVLVIDGGDAGNDQELKRIIKSVGGHVDLWLLTHPHKDHYTAIIQTLNKPDGITYARIGSSWLPDEWEQPIAQWELDELHAWNAFARTLDDRYFTIQEGQHFELGSMTVDVLSATNPDLTANFGNDQSCVFRVSEADFTVLFLGDLGVEAGNRLLEKKYDLKADAVQMAHHGQNGVKEVVYQKISPRYAFWPTPTWLWENAPYPGGRAGEGPYATREVIKWMEKLGTHNITAFDKSVGFDSRTKNTAEY